MTLLLCSVTVPPSTGNFNISCAVDGTAWSVNSSPILNSKAIGLVAQNGLSTESDKVSGGRNHLIPYLFVEFYEAMFIQDFRGCSAVNIYPMHKMPAHFGFDDHWALRPVFFPQRWKRHCRLRREALGNPGLGHSFPWLDHQYSQRSYHWGWGFELSFFQSENFFWCFGEELRNLSDYGPSTSPCKKDVVILYISSIDLGILSYRRLINPGWVIPCINPEILMHSGDPSTSRTSALYLSMKSSVDSWSEGISDDTCDVPNCDNNCVNVESDFVESLINRDTSIVYSSKIDPILEEFAVSLKRNDERVNLEDVFQIPSRYSSDSFLEESDTSLSHLDNSLPEFETSSDHTEETRSGSTTTHANYYLPEYDSFLFEIEPDQEGLISIDNSNNTLLELPEFESFHFDPSFSRPPPELPDVEICLHFEPDAPVIDNFNELNDDQEGGEIDFSQNVEDDNSFTFVI
ncbi:hypothetical protein Tco_0072937 [Tanacetum coccineum]